MEEQKRLTAEQKVELLHKRFDTFPSWLSNREGYARGYREGYVQARRNVVDIIDAPQCGTPFVDVYVVYCDKGDRSLLINKLLDDEIGFYCGHEYVFFNHDMQDYLDENFPLLECEKESWMLSGCLNFKNETDV